MKKFNYLGLLSLLSLIGFLGWKTGDISLYGFFGFGYYIRYFFIIPDELFELNVRKAATSAFLCQMISLVLFMFLGYFVYLDARAIPFAFGLSFATAIFVFSIYLMVLEYRESRCS
ncbi:DUF3796 domain-containing protein [Clostridiisalibacter paucivorans]|uniref:DUF3796 domain-containing protein n=1 Tax=Clostridiisalibacter paucivorans TaxID=408753 RepID=UPI00047E7A47|nr:DUF3796 domain-containing protein [Clostridiisalibacter paucivorans]